MNKLSLLLSTVALPAVLVLACTTDNGDPVHGPQFGPTPERPDGAAADGPLEEGGPGPVVDGGVDAPADGAQPACSSGTIAVLAGGDSSLTGAVQIKGGPWTGAAIAGGAARSNPALVAFGTGFVGLTRGAGDAVQAVTYGTSFGAAAPVGALTTVGTPALTVLGTTAQAVLLSGAPAPNKFFRIQNTGASWSNGGDPVMPPAMAQSFGPSAGTVAAAGTDLVFAQDGDDEGLYTQQWNGTAWSVAAPIAGAGTLKTAPPALVGVDGAYDLVVLYADNTANHVIGYATRNATTKVWATAQITQATAQTAEQMSVARISPSVLVVTYRGGNQRPYVMTGTLGASSITWGVPVALLADSSTVDAAPSVAKGVCGDDAVAVFASAGQVKATHYRAGAWSVPETVTGASGGRVSVATR
jgi:hypothetical protein